MPMKRISRLLLSVALVALFAAMGQAGADEPGSGLDAQIREAELAFAEALAQHDRERFAAFIAEDAVFFGGQTSHHGPAEVLEAWSVYFEPGGPTLSWEPASIEVNEKRGLATSTGPYRLTLPATEDREQQVLGGTYFSVWSRNPTGEWQVIFDGGTPPQAVPPSDTRAGQ